MQTKLPIAAPPAPTSKGATPVAVPVVWMPEGTPDFNRWQGPLTLAIERKHTYLFHYQEAWGDRASHLFRVAERRPGSDSWSYARREFTGEERAALEKFLRLEQPRAWDGVECWGPGYFIAHSWTSIGD